MTSDVHDDAEPVHREVGSGVKASPSQAPDARPVEPSDADDPRPWHRRRIWELKPVQDLIALGVTASLLWLIWLLRAATVPALIALVLAYIFDPVVTRAKQKWGFPRVLTTSICVVFVLAGLGGSSAWLLPRVAQDGLALARALPMHMQHVSQWLQSSELAELANRLRDAANANSGALLDGALDLAGAVAGALGLAAYGLVSLLFGLATFAYLSVQFPKLPNASGLIPKSHREASLAMFRRFESAIGGFLRGQVIVAIFTTAGFIAGFSLVGVPHAPLAGVIGGLFSFVPNGQLSGLLMAWLFGVLATGSGELHPLPVFLYPSLVYAVTQSLETFVITPLVQGSQTRLHPLLVLAALIAGGSVGGLLGVFLAIPLTACAKILIDEVVWPEVRIYVDRT